MPMTRFALGDDRTVEHIERRELAQPHRQHRLSALQGLDLALLVHAQHQRLIGWIEVQPHYVTHLLEEEGVGGKLEALAPMRLESEPVSYTHLTLPTICSV